jgi:hypothetical protein
VKKRKVLPDNIQDRISLISIWLAQEGEIGVLAVRLRQGTASQEEMALAADLIEGKIKSRRPTKSKSSANYRAMHYEIALQVKVLKEINPKWQRKRIIGEIAKGYRLSKSKIYDVLKDFDDKTLTQISQLPRGSIPSK